MGIEVREQCTLQIPMEITSDSILAFHVNLQQQLLSKPAKIYLDCSQLTYIKSEHVSMLLRVHKNCLSVNIPMYLIGLSNQVVHVLEEMDLFDVLANDNTMIHCTTQAITNTYPHISTEYEDRFSVHSRDIDKANQRYLDHLLYMRIPHIIVYILRTLFYEVTLNIRNHAQLSKEEQVIFSAKYPDDKTILTFIDKGVPFDLTMHRLFNNYPTQPGNDGRRHYGLIMINKLSDKVIYKRIDGITNVLRIEKSWRM